jgi:hypothetical protein
MLRSHLAWLGVILACFVGALEAIYWVIIGRTER